MNESTWVQINLSRLDHNLKAIQTLLGHGARHPSKSTGSRNRPAKAPFVCAVVKADAYGLGAPIISQRLVAKGVQMLAVYSPEQAAELLRVSMDCPILVFAPMRQLNRTDTLYRAVVTGRLHLTVHDLPQIDQILKICNTFGCTIPVHLHYDSGLARSGLSEIEFETALDRVNRERHLKLAGIYTHLANAGASDNYAYEQLERFEFIIEKYADRIPAETLTHIANTYATSRDSKFHHQMVRVGLGLYGYGPDITKSPAATDDLTELKPVLRWSSSINHIARYPKGTLVGYESTFECQRDSVLGIVPVGYADGYPQTLSGKSVVVALPDILIGGQPAAAPVRGKINMDQIIVDLTDIPAATVGSVVDLISDDPASPCALAKVATLAGTHQYDLLSRISPRVVRRTIYNEDKDVK